ncbi:MAG: BACON domain-containing protein [Prevotellaceae bacterium]|nr:BACON domain-containing protein [Prevotellaceae bacterium]
MKHVFKTAYCLLLLLLAAGCDKKSDSDGDGATGKDAALAIDKTAISAAHTAGTYTLQVTSTQSWSAEVDSAATWCTLTNASNTGNGTVTVNVVENPTIEARAATVTFTAGTLTRKVAVAQAGAPPALNTDNTAIEAAFPAGTYAVAVTSNVTWTASVNAGATWCTISPATATGNGTVTITVAAQLTAIPRAATITFTAGSPIKTVSVVQEGAPVTLTTDRTSIAAPFTAGSYTVAVTSNATWTASVDAAATWCTVSPATGTSNGTVTVNVMENPATVTRAATVTFTAGTVTRAVSVTQPENMGQPPYAASTQTWVLGTQIWSDVIQWPECNKSSFNTPPADCRSYTSGTNTWYYYGFGFASGNLCKSPWRVPRYDDLMTLHNAGLDTNLPAEWVIGGYYIIQNNTLHDVDNGYYWSQTWEKSIYNIRWFFYEDTRLYYLDTATGLTYYVSHTWADTGNHVSYPARAMRVRCIK